MQRLPAIPGLRTINAREDELNVIGTWIAEQEAPRVHLTFFGFGVCAGLSFTGQGWGSKDEKRLFN